MIDTGKIYLYRSHLLISVMSNQEITRWREGYPSEGQYTWKKGETGRLSALDIRYTFDDKGKQTEVIHAVYPALEKPHDYVRLSDVPF